MKRIRFAFLGGSLLLAALALPLLGEEKAKPDGEKPAEKSTTTEPGTAEKAAALPPIQVEFVDGSVLKLSLREEKISFVTPYGKLLIPLADVRRIECATRIPEETARKIRTAIADLGSTEFNKREAASATLREIGSQAFPALVEASKSKDAEVVRRVQSLLARIRTTVPAEQLVIRPHDVVHTDTSKFTGRIESNVLKAHTFQFGAVEMQLAHVRTMQMPGKMTVAGLPRRIEILWSSTWYKGQILEIKDGRYHVRYDGYDASSDEWVGPERIRIPAASQGSPMSGTGPAPAFPVPPGGGTFPPPGLPGTTLPGPGAPPGGIPAPAPFGPK